MTNKNQQQQQPLTSCSSSASSSSSSSSSSNSSSHSSTSSSKRKKQSRPNHHHHHSNNPHSHSFHLSPSTTPRQARRPESRPISRSSSFDSSPHSPLSASIQDSIHHHHHHHHHHHLHNNQNDSIINQEVDHNKNGTDSSYQDDHPSNKTHNSSTGRCTNSKSLFDPLPSLRRSRMDQLNQQNRSGSKLVPPPNFGFVETDLYRSGEPSELSFRFIGSLKLRSLLWLAPRKPSDKFEEFLKVGGVVLHDLGIRHAASLDAVTEQSVTQALNLILNPSVYPLMIMCAGGSHRTGTVVGCLRKLQGWNLASIFEEYRRYAGAQHHIMNEQFIEFYEIDRLVTAHQSNNGDIKLEEEEKEEEEDDDRTLITSLSTYSLSSTRSPITAATSSTTTMMMMMNQSNELTVVSRSGREESKRRNLSLNDCKTGNDPAGNVIERVTPSDLNRGCGV